MSKLSLGRGMIIAVAVLSIVVPLLVDAIIFPSTHLQNPLWLPHAKLHAAMVIHSSVALGASSLALLVIRWRRPERAEMAIAAFLATASWASLVLARLWPDTSYFAAAEDPGFADMSRLAILGVPIEPNVILAVVCVIVGWISFALMSSRLKYLRSDTQRPR